MAKSYKLFKLLTPSYIVFKCNPFFLTVTSNRKKSHSGNEYEEIYSQERRKLADKKPANTFYEIHICRYQDLEIKII